MQAEPTDCLQALKLCNLPRFAFFLPSNFDDWENSHGGRLNSR